MSKTNAEYQAENKERRKAAYHLVLDMATEAGYLVHRRDTEGYNRFIADIQSGAISVIVALPDDAVSEPA